jgi:S1-C subfamily serine protease
LPATGIVWSSDASGSTIVTASHVVERDEDITITSADGQTHPATLLGRDDGSDIAVLQVAGVQLTPAPRNGSDVKVGQLVLALGRAVDLAATIGVVSAAGGPWHRGRGRRHEKLISSDAPMFPGFSGGPLVDASGAVLGIVSSHLGRGQTLAIPGDVAGRIVESLKAHGKVRRGYLGVGTQPVDLPNALRSAHNITQERGLLLVTVEEDGPAGQAGLSLGDIVIAIGGEPVDGLDSLRTHLSGENVGQSAVVRLLRGGVPQELTVTIGEQG